jgi:hypothetical protein
MRTKHTNYQQKLNQVLTLISANENFDLLLTRKQIAKKVKIGEKLISIAIKEGLISKSNSNFLTINEMSEPEKQTLIKKVVLLYSKYNEEYKKEKNRALNKPQIVKEKSIEERIKDLELKVNFLMCELQRNKESQLTLF